MRTVLLSCVLLVMLLAHAAVQVLVLSSCSMVIQYLVECLVSRAASHIGHDLHAVLAHL